MERILFFSLVFSLWVEKKRINNPGELGNTFFCRSGFENYCFWRTHSLGTQDPWVNISPSLCPWLTSSLLAHPHQIGLWSFPHQGAFMSILPLAHSPLSVLNPRLCQGPSLSGLPSRHPSLAPCLYFYVKNSTTTNKHRSQWSHLG